MVSPCRIKARGPNSDPRPMLPLDLKRAGPLKARAITAPTNPHAHSSRRYRVPLAVAENHQGRQQLPLLDE